jgi:hypothetical protein
MSTASRFLVEIQPPCLSLSSGRIVVIGDATGTGGAFVFAAARFDP